MAFVRRHPASILVVLLAVAGVTAAFAFARPQFRPQYESEMIDFSRRDHVSSDTVRAAFAAHGIHLRYVTTFASWRVLSNRPRPFPADALTVLVAPRTGKGSFGPELEPYDERFDNVMVTYGGDDRRLLERIDAAVSDLR